jgi:hypothetical protein
MTNLTNLPKRENLGDLKYSVKLLKKKGAWKSQLGCRKEQLP